MILKDSDIDFIKSKKWYIDNELIIDCIDVINQSILLREELISINENLINIHEIDGNGYLLNEYSNENLSHLSNIISMRRIIEYLSINKDKRIKECI